jgi:hypothetical protein
VQVVAEAGRIVLTAFEGSADAADAADEGDDLDL